VGYLFQNYALFPRMTVLENIMAGLSGRDKSGKTRKALAWVRQFGLAGLEDRRPAALSGGQQQRAALARMLIREPEAILLDEPFSALDTNLREQMQVRMQELLADRNDAILVTHSRDEVFKLCGELLVMDGGRTLKKGPAKELFRNPGLAAVARLTGCKNISPARRLGEREIAALDWGLTLRTAVPVGDGITHVGIRAHDFVPVFPGEDRGAGVNTGVNAGVNLVRIRPLGSSEEPFERALLFSNAAARRPEEGHELWWKYSKYLKLSYRGTALYPPGIFAIVTVNSKELGAGMRCHYRIFFGLLPLSILLTVFVVCSCSRMGDEASWSQTSGSAFHAGNTRPMMDLSAYRIAYYNAMPQGEGAAALIQETDEPFVVADYGPRGVLPQEIKNPSIYVVFSQPVVPLAQLGEPVREGPFTIDPPLEGVYRWYGSRLLSFESDEEIIPQHRYTITVSNRIRSLGGKELKGERSFSFETEDLSVLSWRIGASDYTGTYNVEPEDAGVLRLIFSYPVNLAEIAKWLEVRAGGQTYSFSLDRLPEIDEKRYRPEQGVLLTVDKPLPLDTDVTVTLRAGARSEPGWQGAKKATSYSYHTLKPFRFSRVSVRSYSSPHREEGATIPIILDFSQTVGDEGVERYFSIAGLPALAKENVKIFDSMVILNNLPLEYQKTYAVTIAAGLTDRWGRALENPQTVQASVGEANSYVYIHNQGSRMLEASFPPGIVWEAQNPVSIKTRSAAAAGPYERISQDSLEAFDVAALPRNSKRFFMEDLSPFLGPGGKGTVAMRWQYETVSSQEDRRINSGDSWLTVQVTDLGLTLRYGYNRVLVWVTRLSTGEAVADAGVELLEGSSPLVRGTTGPQGLAVFDFPDGDFVSRFTNPVLPRGNDMPDKGFRIRVTEGGGAQAGGDQVEFIPNDSHNMWRFDVGAAVSPFAAERQRPLIFLFTDRGLYRPGETVTFRGIDRNLNRGRFEAYQGPYVVEVSTGVFQAAAIAHITGTTTANGGSYGSFTLPANLDPGQYQIRYRRTGPEQRIISFTVANFERLRFEASLTIPDIPYYQGDRLSGTLAASYLAGGALSSAPYTWYLTQEATGFNPGGVWDNWNFGGRLSYGRSYLGNGQGVLGSDGTAAISQELSNRRDEGVAYHYRLEASMQDAARQEISVSAAALVHPASFYIAARLDSGAVEDAASAGGGELFDAVTRPAYFLSSGEPAALSWALVSPDGAAWRHPDLDELEVQLVRYEWKQARQAGIDGRVNLIWHRVEEVEETRTISPDNSAWGEEDVIRGVVNFTPETSGQWECRLRSRDQKGRLTFTSFTFYVSGSGWVRWGSDNVDSIGLSTDRPSYAPGDTARVLVRSPLPRGTYLLTLEREGIFSERIVELEGSALTIDIPIEESYVPIVYAVLSSYTVRSGPPDNSYYEPDLDKPKGIFGLTPIYVDHESRHYQVEIEPVKGVYGPADEAEVTVKVSLDGKPAPGTELTFMAVDRGVLDLIDYHVPDPIAYFYNPQNFPLGVRGADSRSLLIDPVTYSLADLQGGDDEAGSSKLDERKDFRPTAIFEPYLVTGHDGTATVRFKLPDSLTTYRCTAVAVGLHDFGIAEQDLRVSAPMTATAALPRKLRWRDTGTVSLVVTNLEKESAEATVSLAVLQDERDNAGDTVLEVDGPAERTLTIPAGKTEEVRFKVAALGSGTGHLEFTLRSPKVNERILRDILVDRPVVYETVTTIGNLGTRDTFVEEGLVLPQFIPEGTGNISVSLSVSRLAMLKEALGYLLSYPYGCLEQRTARLLPLLAFGDHLGAFDLESPVENPAEEIKKELESLAKLQLANGSWPYWPNGRQGHVLVTLRVIHIAALAKSRGFAIPPALDSYKALAFIAGAGDRIFQGDPFLKGYSLWVRAMSGERIGSEISAFLKGGDELGISGLSFAGLAALELGMGDLAAGVLERVRSFIRPGTRTLDLTDTYERRGNFWGYDVDRYALALMLFHALRSGDDMSSRLASSLIERQRNGIWGNTASSFWAVLAMGRLADSEAADWKAGASLKARVTIDARPLLDAEFASYGGTPVSVSKGLSESPLDTLERAALLPLRIEREAANNGTGRLYYNAGFRYGIPAELAEPRDEGIGVFVETVDSGGVPVESILVPGETYTRRITVSSSRDRTFLALCSPVPSGAEIVDAVFVTSSTVPPAAEPEAEQELWYDYRRAEPLRFVMDDEIRFHWDFFPAGKREVEFRFRAVMPGVYPTPPASAECMYEPEIFGRAAGELVQIRD
jgi:uncharacterized protein YfaS (alpha-2-macroglobulin family)/ABC-type sulfate/molybdate transport systems ATPase subunit